MPLIEAPWMQTTCIYLASLTLPMDASSWNAAVIAAVSYVPTFATTFLWTWLRTKTFASLVANSSFVSTVETPII